MDDKKRREKLVEENLRLVNHLCKRFSGRGIEYDDLYQAGSLGLVKAATAFNEELGFRFSTYAVPVILGEIKRLFRDGGSVKVSRSIKELSLKIAKEKVILENKLGVEPTVSQIAQSLGTDTQNVVEALDAARPTVSLTALSDDGDKQTDIPVVSEENEIENRIMLDEAIAKLSYDEQTIVKLRFFKQFTQNETARKLNVSQVSISRQEKKILLKLRKIINSVA
ncbi:MAG: sigma-70 family RNA polymerase sigma factor [Clostridia bacterium]|nr:sigma-70 family RNA polymerase sigma factor [Clostridia bacterium]